MQSALTIGTSLPRSRKNCFLPKLLTLRLLFSSVFSSGQPVLLTCNYQYRNPFLFIFFCTYCQRCTTFPEFSHLNSPPLFNLFETSFLSNFFSDLLHLLLPQNIRSLHLRVVVGTSFCNVPTGSLEIFLTKGLDKKSRIISPNMKEFLKRIV